MSARLVVATMLRFGGSFVKALANAFQAADPVNFERLRAAFPDIWSRYETMAGKMSDGKEVA